MAVIVINPPGALGPVRAVRLQGSGLPVDAIRVTSEGHPLLYGVASSRVSLTQTVVLEADGLLEPLWVGPSGPILAAGEVRGQRITVMAFVPERSERLPLMASYPLLLGNAIYWSMAPTAQQHGGNNHVTGDLVGLQGKTISWSGGPDDPQRVPLRGRWAELDRIGLWETDAGERGSASLLSPKETRLAASEKRSGVDQADKSAESWLDLRGELTLNLLWAALALLVLESCLFHRCAVY